MSLAIITGASSGIGSEFARQLKAMAGIDEFWFIARRADRMEALRDELGVKAKIITADLSVPEGIEAVRSALKEEKPKVKFLVNAAGFGNFGSFEQIPEEEIVKMIDLNDKALVSITYLTLPYMREGACIYQLGSLSSFQPVPYITTYGATKLGVLDNRLCISTTYNATEVLCLRGEECSCDIAERRAIFDSCRGDITRNTSTVEDITTGTCALHRALNNTTLDS